MRFESSIRIEKVVSDRDWEAVIQLRQKVYVESDSRISEVSSFAETFDRFNRQAAYFLAFRQDQPIGTLKLIDDSEQGLPCEEIASLAHLKKLGRCVEVGHLIVLPEFRKSRVSMYLFREATHYSASQLGARFLIGDVFIDGSKQNFEHDFYHMMGFENVHGPYRDHRFLESPLSLIISLDLEKLPLYARTAEGTRKKLFTFFLKGLNQALPQDEDLTTKV